MEWESPVPASGPVVAFGGMAGFWWLSRLPPYVTAVGPYGGVIGRKKPRVHFGCIMCPGVLHASFGAAVEADRPAEPEARVASPLRASCEWMAAAPAGCKVVESGAADPPS